MTGLSFQQTATTLATLTLIAAIVALSLLRSPDQARKFHVVPIEFAEARGANEWTPETRDAFLRDALNQWSVDSANQRGQGNLGPQQWLPPFGQCRYISRFVEVMERYGLDRNLKEMKRLYSQRQQCYTQFQ